ncbi:MAG: zf-TFIIB domain-containing protein [Leptolyngbyaceae cyanobacterium]
MHNATEPQYSCPVCPGQRLQKIKIVPEKSKNRRACLTLDGCQRCGGVWFDKGEVTISTQITSPQDRQRIIQKPKKGQIHCRSCDTLMDRNLDQCPACNHYNRIACPVCKRTLARKRQQQLVLDVCHHCQGVWFDQAELLAIWNGPLPIFWESCDRTSKHSNPSQSLPSLSNATTRSTVEARPRNTSQNLPSDSNAIMRTTVENSLGNATANILYDSGLAVASSAVEGSAEAAEATVESLAEVAGAAFETIGDLSEVAAVALEGTAEIAGGLAEALAEVIAGLFSG